MKMRLSYIAVCFLILPFLGACGTGGNANIPPTAVSKASEILPCASSQGGADKSTATGSTDLSFEEVRSKYEEARAVITDGNSDQDAQNKALDKLDAYWHTLPGKSVRDWQGWVVDMEADTAPLVPTQATSVPADNTQARTIIISMEDPYSSPPVPETPVPSPRFRSSLKPPYVYLNRAVSPKEERLCVGDKISFSGSIGDVPGEYGEPGVIIPSAQVEIVEKREPKADVAADLKDVVISLDRTMCFGTCPDYRVTLFGDGTVVFEGRTFTKVLGYKIGSIEEAKIRELLAEAEKASFFTEKSYTSYEVTDNPSATLSISTSDKGNRVDHYYGDSNAPARLTALESKVDEILNTIQWVR